MEAEEAHVEIYSYTLHAQALFLLFPLHPQLSWFSIPSFRKTEVSDEKRRTLRLETVLRFRRIVELGNRFFFSGPSPMSVHFPPIFPPMEWTVLPPSEETSNLQIVGIQCHARQRSPWPFHGFLCRGTLSLVNSSNLSKNPPSNVSSGNDKFIFCPGPPNGSFPPPMGTTFFR